MIKNSRSLSNHFQLSPMSKMLSSNYGSNLRAHVFSKDTNRKMGFALQQWIDNLAETHLIHEGRFTWLAGALISVSVLSRWLLTRLNLVLSDYKTSWFYHRPALELLSFVLLFLSTSVCASVKQGE